MLVNVSPRFLQIFFMYALLYCSNVVCAVSVCYMLTKKEMRKVSLLELLHLSLGLLLVRYMYSMNEHLNAKVCAYKVPVPDAHAAYCDANGHSQHFRECDQRSIQPVWPDALQTTKGQLITTSKRSSDDFLA